MNVKRIAIMFLLALAAFAGAQAEPKITLSAVPKNAVAGSQIKLTVSITFSEGFHGYQNPPAQDYEIPVVVKVDGKEFKLVKAHYPPGEDAKVAGGDKPTKTYGGTVKIPIVVTVPAKVGVKNLKVVVSYQQCNEESCLPPAEISATAKVTVVKKGSKS